MKELKKISIIWGLLLFIIFAALTFFALKWKAKTAPFFDLEKTLVSKTKSYYESEHAYPAKGQSVNISFEELKNANMLEELKVNDETCEGYVKVENSGVVEYTAYIKCQSYTTKDYDKYKNN